ncbi:MAG: ribonuclease HII [Myxococcota bacterium]
MRTIAEIASSLRDLDASDLHALASDPRKGVRALVKREEKHRAAVLAESERLALMLRHERELWQAGHVVAGVDEVGVGPLAGPVMAAAVILPPGTSIEGIDDSKQLDRNARESLSQTLKSVALAWAVGSCDRQELDRMNVYQAAREAMRRAVLGLNVAPTALLIDARTVPGVPAAQRPIVKGDQRSQSIAAASIVAKVERDGWMRAAAERYPGYGFERHKGYYCPQHLEALKRLGPCPLHRRSFSPVAALCNSDELESLGAEREVAATERRQEQIELF